jgi:hypothetical protein
MVTWLKPTDSVGEHLRSLSIDFSVVELESLSSSTRNSRSIRDAVMRAAEDDPGYEYVLLGYSKGTPDILEAVVSFPEVRKHIAAVVSLAGAVGGSPLANRFEGSALGVFRNWPGAQCSLGDGGAIESLRPATRQRWLHDNELPRDFAYYSIATLPEPARISKALRPGYDFLSGVDARNDGQLIFYDQIIPGSHFLGYLNADHWAVAVPIGRSHELVSSLMVDENAFPREALLEAILRIVEGDLTLPPH